MFKTIWTRLRESPFLGFWDADNKQSFYVYFVLFMATVSDFIAATTSPILAVQIATAIFCLLWFGLLLFNLHTLRVMPTLQMASLIACLEETVVCFFSGGVYASAMSWFELIVIANYFIAGRRAGFFWFFVVILMYFLQLYLHDYIDSGVPLGVQPDQAASSFFDYSFMAVALILVLLFFHRLHRTAVLELRVRQTELETTQKELEHTLQMREHFIASVSHELRTPMNAILGLSDFLLSAVNNKPRATMVLEHTRQSADHLMTVINDVLDYTQFKSGQLRARIEKMPLRQTLQTAFDLFKPRIDDLAVTYEFEFADDVPEWVESDRHRLTQILVNLLGNAIKFTHQGRVLLRVSVHDKGILFSVKDSGIGISNEQQQGLFERFNQADSSIQSKYGGSGLGLTISQRLVQLLGGRMGFESQSKQGSLFWFWLPLVGVEPPATDRHARNNTMQTESRAWRFLIVDDHPVNRLLLRQVLTRTWPHAVITEAENGHEALSFLKTQVCDLVLMDMVMPDFDGIETTQALHVHMNNLGQTAPPVLGLTANVNPHDLQRFQEAGLQAVMLKPFERVKLCTEIDRLLANKLSHS